MATLGRKVLIGLICHLDISQKALASSNRFWWATLLPLRIIRVLIRDEMLFDYSKFTLHGLSWKAEYKSIRDDLRIDNSRFVGQKVQVLLHDRRCSYSLTNSYP